MSAIKRQVSPIKCPQINALKKQRLLTEFTEGEENLVPNRKSPGKMSGEDYDFLFDEETDFHVKMLDLETKVLSYRNLDLSEWNRCSVKEVERDRKTFDLTLVLYAVDETNKESDGAENQRAVCHLQGPWCHTRVSIGDIVSIKGVWDQDLQAYKVDKDDGFIVTNPDTLISGTTVVGSLFCRRKAVLQDRFRGIDANNKIMVIGSLVHELLQIVLAKGLKTYSTIQNVAKELLESQETAFTLYASLMSREETALEIQKFLPNILSFVQRYLDGQEPPIIKNDTFQGTISEISDIEENVWVPKLGLKGKIDVSVRIQRRRNALSFSNAYNDPIPLELKTGKASFSMEHKGQLILYQMMLAALGKKTRSGLLLYLRDGIMREIEGARNEQRDLILLRNDLSHYLTHIPTLTPNQKPLATGNNVNLLQPFELPEPISHHSACGNCAYATICCTFAKTDQELHLRAGHPLAKVMSESTSHLQPLDYEYFIRWCGLLLLEEQEAKKSNFLRSLWTDAPEQRVRNGRAIMNLQLQTKVSCKEARYLHTFEIQNSSKCDEVPDLTLIGFTIGEYVIVSSTKRLAIAAGCVYDLTKSTISVSLERNLLKNYACQHFIVDKHESQSGNVFNFTNLGLLLDNNERANALRSNIVHFKRPIITTTLPKALKSNDTERILRDLNPIQRSAVSKALSTDSFILIKGLPGTGKTQTLVAIVRLLHLMNKSILITSHTHSAVDNLLLRLKPYSLKMLRLGSGSRANPQLREFSECELTAECHSEADLTRVYNAYNIVGATCLGTGHSIFLHRKFDFCIVDEASQVMQCTVLRPLFFSEKFILVGDPDQLPPLIRSKEARLRGADESLFQRLDSEEATAVLTLQYRMNKTITKLANHLTYGGKLQCANRDVETAVMSLQPTATQLGVGKNWIKTVLNTHIDLAVFLLDTLDCAERSFEFATTKHSTTCAVIEQTYAEDQPLASEANATESSRKRKSSQRLSKYTNYCDAAIIFQLVKFLLSAGYQSDRIGIIAPYRAQVELLRKLNEQHDKYYDSLEFDKVEVNTVDQYQGRDKDVIIYSCSKTGSASARDMERSHEAEILEDKRRLTVAITRSKLKLILVGDTECLKQYTPFQELFARIPSHCRLKLEDGKLGFSWKSVMNGLADVLNT